MSKVNYHLKNNCSLYLTQHLPPENIRYIFEISDVKKQNLFSVPEGQRVTYRRGIRIPDFMLIMRFIVWNDGQKSWPFGCAKTFDTSMFLPGIFTMAHYGITLCLQGYSSDYGEACAGMSSGLFQESAWQGNVLHIHFGINAASMSDIEIKNSCHINPKHT